MATLLDDDPNPAARAEAVRVARTQYVWDHTYLAPLPMLQIPHTGRRPGVLEFLRGSFLELPPGERPDDDMPERRLAATAPGIAHIELDGLRARFGPAFTDPSQYHLLMADLPTPPNLAGNARYDANWDGDFAFAWQRLAGPNPVVVERPTGERLRDLLGRTGLTDAHLTEALGAGAPTISEAVAAGTLMFCDYAVLDTPSPLPCGTFDGREKHVTAPILVIVWDARLGEPVPVAIRLGQTPEAPLRIRENTERWAVAKAMVSVADFNHHEMGTHLSLTHFVQEGLAVALHRSLPPQHPVATLLLPHFKYLLFNNFAGRELLVQPGGFVEKILAGELADGSLEIVRRFYERFDFADLDLPRSLAGRGMMSRSGVPDYPYRDDGLELWAPIDTWVRAYLARYYPSDAAVATDVELQRWAAETTSPDGAHLRGFPASFDAIDTLATTLTRILFLAGPHHAAVNYPQNHSMLVVPNMPGAGYAPIADRLIELLPPMAAAHAQIEIIWTLTCYQYGALGQYGAALSDPQVQEPLAAFQRHLASAEGVIASRNAQGLRKRAPYLYLLPSRVPNSTNI